MFIAPDFEAIVLQRQEENTQKLRTEIFKKGMPGWALTKIDNLAKKHNVEFEYLFYNFLIDPLLIPFIAKDPTKQSVHQAVILNEIKKQVSIFQDVKLLESTGPNALYVDGPNLSIGTVSSSKIKSLDFHWILPSGTVVYSMHKYTKESGGAQDNQRNDIICFLEQCQVYTSKKNDVLFLALVDGPYYLPHLQSLKKFENSNIMVGPSEEVINKLISKVQGGAT